ncbi:hypothetical protein O9992_18300 [Vibrio lentus]|nr:hypothetical protein [Vibrio lentus]
MNQTIESIQQLKEKIAAQYLAANQADSLLEKYLGQWQIKVTQVRDLERQYTELLNSVQASQRTLATQQAALQAAKDSKLAQDKALTELVSAENQAKRNSDGTLCSNKPMSIPLMHKEVLEHWAVIPIRWWILIAVLFRRHTGITSKSVNCREAITQRSENSQRSSRSASGTLSEQ